jgi:NitT/TauT family transport system permease protein
MAMNKLASWLPAAWPPVLSFAAGTLLAELLIRLLHVPPYLLPAPSAVVAVMLDRAPDLLHAMLTTAIAATVGFALAVSIGILTAILMSTSRLVQRAVYPYMIFFQTVPVVAVAPLLVIWFGAGLQSVTICALIVSIFPIIANTLTGLLSTDPALADMFKLYRANWLETMLKLRLPSALPNIITGMRIAAGLAVIGAIVGEFVAAVLDQPGLGVKLMEARRLGQTDFVFAAILVASVLGLTMFGAVNLFGHVVLRHWHASANK